MNRKRVSQSSAFRAKKIASLVGIHFPYYRLPQEEYE